MKDKYTESGLREKTRSVKSRNGRTRTEHVSWRGYLKYQEPNPDYREPPTEGEDTRTAKQRRRLRWREITTTFDPNTVRTKSEATDALTEWKKRMNAEHRAANQPSANVAVGEYVTAYIDGLETSQSVSMRTIHGYRTIASRIDSAFPDTALRDLKPDMIQAWEGRLLKSGLSASTVTKYHRLLSEACRHAVNVDVLVKNPCQAVRTPKKRPPSPNSLTAEGYARLAATLDVLEPTPLVTAAAIAMHTGMRQGEVCGLRWRCYDEEAKTLRIEESIGRAGGETFSNAPKTEASRRTVPVSPRLADILERRRACMKQQLQSAKLKMKDEAFSNLYITGMIDGRFHDPIQVSRHWKTLSSALGLVGTQGRAITFHDLRHSFATRAIAAGADVKAVAAVLGHTNAAITLNVYADADPESKLRATKLVSRAIAAQGEVLPYAVTLEDTGLPESER